MAQAQRWLARAAQELSAPEHAGPRGTLFRSRAAVTRAFYGWAVERCARAPGRAPCRQAELAGALLPGHKRPFSVLPAAGRMESVQAVDQRCSRRRDTSRKGSTALRFQNDPEPEKALSCGGYGCGGQNSDRLKTVRSFQGLHRHVRRPGLPVGREQA